MKGGYHVMKAQTSEIQIEKCRTDKVRDEGTKMDKVEFLRKLGEVVKKLDLDLEKFCIISGGALLMCGIKEKTSDIDLKMGSDYFQGIRERFSVKQSPKYDYLQVVTCEIDDEMLEIEVAVLDDEWEKQTKVMNGYRIESLRRQLKWMLDHNRPKDQHYIEAIREYLRLHPDA